MKRAEIARTTARSVAERLFQTEAAIDAALSSIAGFAQSLPSAGKDAGFAATRGQRIYEGLAEALVAQSQARARIVEIHGLLADLKEDSFMRGVTMIGGGTKPTDPDIPIPLPPTGRLALAAVA